MRHMFLSETPPDVVCDTAFFLFAEQLESNAVVTDHQKNVFLSPDL